ncbi:MAG: double-strand break repair Rad50 ATPase [Myxococcaceae bacterium]|nr:double-strand break repair Rad50 ATPase [Myxococcaceae bacterium]
MRIAQLQLIAYGPFRGLELDLSAPGIHVVFGRNEAGKSTTLRAITGLLYGIDTRTLDAHVHKPSELRIGGTLLGDDGARVRVVRRKGVSKGGANTLLDERGQAVDEAVLQRLLRGVSEETFRHAFGLDHDTLQLGAKALLDGRGDIGGSLFDASVGGGGDARRVLAQLNEEADRLYKPRASAPPLNAALKELVEAQKAIKDQQSLPEAFTKQQKEIEDARQRRDELGARKSALATRKAQIVRARHRVPLERRRTQAAEAFAAARFGEVTRHAARITSLHARLEAYEGATKAHRDGAAASEVLRDRVAEAARRAGVAVGSKELRIDLRTQNRIQKLVQERSSLAERLETSRVEIARIERELARYRAEIQAPESVDAVAVAALERAVGVARKLGDLPARHATEVTRAARKRADAETKAAALGLFEGTIEALVALRLPAAASLDALATRVAELDRAVARQVDAASALEAEARSIEQQLAAASGDFAPPGAAELHTARAARDEAWARVREATASEPRPDAQALAALGSTFERAVRDADAVADRMIVEADRVTTLARLRAQQTTLAEQRARVEVELAKARADRAMVDDEHERTWADAGIAPRAGRRLGLPEMRTWLTKHAQIVEAFAAVREAELDAEETSRTIAAARAELAAALVAIEGAAASAASKADARSLAELLDVATPRLESIESARRNAAEAARAIAKLEVQHDERKAGAERDESALGETRARLTELVAPLGVASDADGEEILRALDALRELFGLEDQRAEAESRAAAAGTDATTFEHEAALAAAELAPDLVGLTARAIVAELADRSRKAHAAEEQLAGIDAQLAELEDHVIADDVRALVADADAAQRALEEVDAELEEVERDHTRKAQDLGGLEVGLEKMRRDTGAAEKASEAQEALARIRLVVERYARAKVGAFILGREIERYRAENQGPMLTKASQLFARLTLGHYTGVRAGYNDKDKPALKCVRDGNVEVDVEGLSEGTRDQLYLSLRLASLLRYADLAEPMPLVLDDVLIQFDDERSRAALEIIAELSTRMQVLFFTHHARLVELARAAVPASSLTIHELSSAPAAVAISAAPA